MLASLGRWGGRLAAFAPWTNVFGLARTLLAVGTCATLLFSSVDTLFRPAVNVTQVPRCSGVAQTSLFCLAPSGQLEAARWAAVAILLVVISGWRPRWTALPHWWVTFSLMASAATIDGGDQVANVLTLLIIPVALTDSRKWHWVTPEGFASPASTAKEESRRVVAALTLLLVRLQVAAVYFHAFVGKLQAPDWVDGTVLYYWFSFPGLQAAGWLGTALVWLATIPVFVALMTWGTLVLEFSLMLSLVLPRPARRYLLVAGVALHLAIAVVMGLVSFGLSMFAALLLYLRPMDEPLPSPKQVLAAAKSILGWRLIGLTGRVPGPQVERTSRG